LIGDELDILPIEQCLELTPEIGRIRQAYDFDVISEIGM
jgi:hypothetical protein